MMIVMMVRYIGTLGNHGSGDSKPRGVVVLIPLTNTLRDCNNEYTDYKDKYQREHHDEIPNPKFNPNPMLSAFLLNIYEIFYEKSSADSDSPLLSSVHIIKRNQFNLALVTKLLQIFGKSGFGENVEVILLTLTENICIVLD